MVGARLLGWLNPAAVKTELDWEAGERELVSLKYGAGVTNRAIAQLTGLSESNVGTILHRTIDALRARWDEGGAR